jgi:hypothetical protein
MLRTLGFFSLTALCFVAGFIGIGWMKLGGPLPVPVVKARPMQASASLPTFEQTVERIKREPAPNQTLQSDNDPGRDALRLDAMQAANAYVQSPCDGTMRDNLVKALTVYSKAWAEKSGCGAYTCGGGARVELAAQMFSTPLDLKVREAVNDAFQQGGITIDDFPRDLRIQTLLIAQDRGRTESACGVPSQQSRK